MAGERVLVVASPVCVVMQDYRQTRLGIQETLQGLINGSCTLVRDVDKTHAAVGKGGRQSSVTSPKRYTYIAGRKRIRRHWERTSSVQWFLLLHIVRIAESKKVSVGVNYDRITDLGKCVWT
jgi:hypothetical protein